MKLRVLTFVLAIAAVSTVASAQTVEPQPATPPELQAEPQVTDTQLQVDSELLPEAPPPVAGPRLQVLASAPQDSPLVAAAKRAKAQQKTHVVITNATIKKHSSKARFTTTSHQPPLKDIPPAAVAQSQPVVAGKPQQRPVKSAQSVEPHDDELDDLVDRIKCPTCLPILEPIPEHLSLTKAEAAHAGPQIVPGHEPQLSETTPPEPVQPPER